ncbi:MAG: DUF3108 domain-containing protein [Nevskia sp.]
MKTITAAYSFALALAAISGAQAADAALPALDVTYAVNWSGLGVGDAAVSLKPDAQSGCYVYTSTTKPVGFIRALYGSPNESSRFCVRDGRIRSQRFESVLEGDDKQSYTLAFDYAKHQVTDENGASREIPDEAVDSFSLQQAVRLWAAAHAKDENPPVGEFTMVDRKNFTHYKFRFAGRETLQTPAGSFDTVKIERIDNPEKIGRFWLAPERDYMPVRIETRNGNKPPLVLSLKK